MSTNELTGLLLNCYQSDRVEALLQANTKERSHLKQQITMLVKACKIALDALGCDRTDQDRLEAQRIIHEAIKQSQKK